MRRGVAAKNGERGENIYTHTQLLTSSNSIRKIRSSRLILSILINFHHGRHEYFTHVNASGVARREEREKSGNRSCEKMFASFAMAILVLSSKTCVEIKSLRTFLSFSRADIYTVIFLKTFSIFLKLKQEDRQMITHNSNKFNIC